MTEFFNQLTEQKEKIFLQCFWQLNLVIKVFKSQSKKEKGKLCISKIKIISNLGVQLVNVSLHPQRTLMSLRISPRELVSGSESTIHLFPFRDEQVSAMCWWPNQRTFPPLSFLEAAAFLSSSLYASILFWTGVHVANSPQVNIWMSFSFFPAE